MCVHACVCGCSEHVEHVRPAPSPDSGRRPHRRLLCCFATAIHSQSLFLFVAQDVAAIRSALRRPLCCLQHSRPRPLAHWLPLHLRPTTSSCLLSLRRTLLSPCQFPLRPCHLRQHPQQQQQQSIISSSTKTVVSAPKCVPLSHSRVRVSMRTAVIVGDFAPAATLEIGRHALTVLKSVLERPSARRCLLPVSFSLDCSLCLLPIVLDHAVRVVTRNLHPTLLSRSSLRRPTCRLQRSRPHIAYRLPLPHRSPLPPSPPSCVESLQVLTRRSLSTALSQDGNNSDCPRRDNCF